jgi:hypothetical protein
MKKIETEIVIHSTPQKVWAVLTDFENYPNWNPFVKSLTGEVKEGKKIRIVLPGMKFRPTVLKFEPEKEFRWIGHLWMKGLFDGEHSFILSDNKNGTTTLKHDEQFTGILVPLFRKMLDTKTKAGFEKFNQELKRRRVENNL